MCNVLNNLNKGALKQDPQCTLEASKLQHVKRNRWGRMSKVKEEGKENFHSFNKKATHNSLCDNTTCTKDLYNGIRKQE